MTDAAMAPPTRRVDMWYAGTAPQRRLTVGFRIILAIPQFIVLYFLSIAAVIVLVIGWFAALFMGRLPEWVHSFISGVVRWTTRVYAYMYLLTDRYPQFSLDDEDYPARPILPAPGRLNRWAVLFRFILVIPAAVFAQIVEYGLTFPLLFVVWLMVLFTGRMHPALYGAYAALLRYQVRLHSWFAMLTSEYAWGMLGDRAEAAAPPAFAPPPPPFAAPPGPAPTTGVPSSAPGSPPPSPSRPMSQPQPQPQPYAYPSGSTESAETPAGGVGCGRGRASGEAGPEPPAAAPEQAGRADPSGAAPPPVWPPPMPPPPAAPPPPPTGLGAMPPPSPWERAVPSMPTGDATPGWGTLVLTGAARGWIIFAIVWGSVLFLGQSVVQSLARHHNQHTSAQQVNTVVSDYNGTDVAIHAAISRFHSCSTVACLRASHLDAASKLTRFDSDLRGMSLPSNAGQPAHVVESDTTQLASILTELANASSLSTYQSTVQSSNINTILSSYHGDTQNLVGTLHADLG